MDSAFARRDYLNVKRTGYKGKPASYERKVNSAVPMTVKKSSSVKGADSMNTVIPAKVSAPTANGKSVRNSPVRVGVRDTYRVASKTTAVPDARKSSVSVKKQEKAKGFVYIEHCGVAGTFRDAFFTKRVKTNEKSCFDKIVLTLLFAVLMFFVAGSYCEYYDEFKLTNEMRAGISECREEQAKLLVAIEERNDRLELEEYAVNTLGMVKSDKLTTHYVNISEQDIVNIKSAEENEAVTNGVLLSGFKSVMSNFTAKN